MKHIYRRMTSAFLLVLFVCSCTISAFAAIADGQTVRKEAVLTYDNGAISVHWIDGTGEALYCIDPSAMSSNTFTLPSGSVTVTPSTYWNSLSAATQQSLRLLLYYAPKTYNASTKYQCAAAQAIAWEYINGLRALDDYRTYPLSYADIITANATAYSAYQTLIQKIQRHMKIPTINGDTVTLNGIGEENAVYTLYDENSVLAGDWEPVSSNANVHVSIAESNGIRQNRLKVWLSGDIGSETVTITLRHKVLTDVVGNAIDPRASTARWIANYPYGGNSTAGQPLIGGTLPDPPEARIQVKANLNASLEITKASPDGNVSGIQFKIEKYEPGIGWWTYATKTTDSTGKIVLEGLKVGERIRVTETVPAGYICASDNPQEITIAAGTNRLTFQNRPMASLEIVKTSSDGNVSGIQFKIEKYESGIGWWTYATKTTDSTGKIVIEGLNVGDRVRVTEIVPTGYICDSDNPQEITIRAGSNRLPFRNNSQMSSLEIIKESPDGNVSGIQFKIEKLEANGTSWQTIGTRTTDTDGKIRIENQTAGDKLRVTEMFPENYACESDNPQEITIAAGTNRLSFRNKPLIGLELIKTSDDGAVEGIEFTIERRNGARYELLGKYTTDASGKIHLTELTAGDEYRVTETVPEAYVSVQPVQTFTAQLGTNTVRFENRLMRGSLKIVKLGEGTETPLQGAGYEIFDRDGAKVAEGYTDENGELVFENLAYGTYTYQEFEAPAGFELDDTAYDFSIREDDVEIVREHYNQPKEGSITIYKVDENNRPLPGVTFLLEYLTEDADDWAPVTLRSEDDPVQEGYCTSDGLQDGKLTTDENGYAVFSGLCIDTELSEVRYRITEVSTKPGYSLLAGYVFEGNLAEESEIDRSFTVVNQPEFSMPSTGGRGYKLAIAILTLTGIGVGAIFLLRKKKKD